MLSVYYVVAAASVALWLPLLRFFFKKWRERHNPMSLSISGIIGLLIWTSVAGIWYVAGQITEPVIVMSSGIMSVLTAAAAHYALYWSKKKFPAQRKRDPHP